MSDGKADIDDGDSSDDDDDGDGDGGAGELEGEEGDGLNELEHKGMTEKSMRPCIKLLDDYMIQSQCSNVVTSTSD